MLQLSRWKVSLVLVTAILAILFTIPNMLPQSVLASLPSWAPAKRLNLGLDLQGGVYLLLEVDGAALKKDRLTAIGEDIRNRLAEKHITFTGPGQVGDTVNVTISDPAQVELALTEINGLATPSAGGGRTLSVARDGQTITVTYLAEALRADTSRALDQSIEIVRRRIDAIGTKEPAITRQGTNRIVVQAPGESDPEKIKKLIGKTAKLTFQMVEGDENTALEAQQTGVTPPGSELLPSDEPGGAMLLVRRRAVVSGEQLTRATQGFDSQTGEIAIDFTFNSAGARAFGEVTRTNIGKRFAIILDGRVVSAPVIRSPIMGGQGQITGSFDMASAKELVIQLREGALPARLVPMEQRTVGAELGADAVHAGMISTVVGFIAIIVFMVMSYGFVFGGASVVALVLNVFMIIGFMSVSQGTLTLPGIAGLILTLAVAVDANVLIYERIRDEERAGRPPLMAIEVGYKRALVSILDANATSLISAVIMLWQGSGPVKGFALMLAVGVFTSLFSSILVSQVLLGLWFRIVRPKTLPI